MLEQNTIRVGGRQVRQTLSDLKSLKQTGRMMVEIVRMYWYDIPPHMLQWPMQEQFFNYIKKLPYQADPEDMESIQRPAFTLDRSWKGPRDCDDKAICIASWLYAHNIPFRFMAVSYAPGNDLEHAVVECDPPDSVKTIIDATYPKIHWPNEGPYYNHYAISPWIKGAK